MSRLKTKPLGRTGIEVSVVGLGCWGIGGPMERDGTISGYGQVDDAESLRMLRHALDQGVNFLDTAPWYGDGHSERLVGEVIRNRREAVVVSTKVGIFLKDKRYTSDYSGDYIMAHYEDSLERLGTDYIDVYVLHSPEAGLYQPSGMAALRELKRRGIIRAYGISFPASHAESESFFLPLCEAEAVDVVQLRFNLLSWSARERILPRLRQLDVGVVCREPFFFGYLTGRFTRETVFDPTSDVRSTWPRERHLSLVEASERFDFLHRGLDCSAAQAALAYCLSQDQVATTIPGAMTVAELQDNLQAASLEFDPASILRVQEIQEHHVGTEL